jgi:2-polyprenyl-6-hydroxyphenyl methylase/3-demethylubiquinone-9 3-methyltransferase
VAVPEETGSNSSAKVGPNADPRFVEYYAQNSLGVQTQARFRAVMQAVVALRHELGLPTSGLQMADIGCGAGTQALLWAVAGHRALGVDVSVPLIEIATKRARERGLDAEFRVGSAEALPFTDGSLDVVMLSELLEHVPRWEPCVDEAVRVLRPGGILYLSTTNYLCPVQQEFALPGYSWYPAFIKKRCEQLAVTSCRHWVRAASYPAVHWFSFYHLRHYLNARGVEARDRFDMMEVGSSRLKALVRALVRALPPARFLGHMVTPYTVVFGYRRLD